VGSFSLPAPPFVGPIVSPLPAPPEGLQNVSSHMKPGAVVGGRISEGG